MSCSGGSADDAASIYVRLSEPLTPYRVDEARAAALSAALQAAGEPHEVEGFDSGVHFLVKGPVRPGADGLVWGGGSHSVAYAGTIEAVSGEWTMISVQIRVPLIINVQRPF